MDKRLRIALVGLNQIPLDWAGNSDRIRKAWREARDGGAQLIIFPELCLTGYGCEDMFLHPHVAEIAMELLWELAAECGDEVVLLGLPFQYQNSLFNGLAVIHQGRVHAITAKCHLAKDGIHYEPRWFSPWPKGEREVMAIAGEDVQIGNLSYALNGLSFALEICEDAWVDPEHRPCQIVKQADWVFNASASHFSMNKADIREALVKNSSELFNVGYAYTNLVGCESGRAIYDGELLIAEKGRITNRSGRLYFDETRVLLHDIEYEAREHDADVGLTTPPAPTTEISQPETQRRFALKYDEFGRAASLALFDYMRKSRSNGFTLSLSGGVDSSAVAVLVRIMVHRILVELDAEELHERLRFLKGLPENSDPNAWTRRLLTTVYQATRNSGPVTRQAASELSAAIGAQHHELDVDPVVENYKSMISETIGRSLEWQKDDIAMQNIQARVRAPSVWMMTNLNGSLLLSTSNRSEVAVGYATMDGDTAGGLSPIAGVEKTFLRAWLKHMETDGLGEEIPPIAALRYVNQQEPTAELRPPEQVQKDEDDLMPYEVLDALEGAIIARRLSPARAFEVMRETFSEIEEQQLRDWIRKFCRMFALSQWKRERYAPAFHLDDRNLDPKTWARYPILSGAFTHELSQL